MKRQPRGPRCPECGAVMHPGKTGDVVCSFRNDHANLKKRRAEAANKSAAKRKK